MIYKHKYTWILIVCFLWIVRYPAVSALARFFGHTAAGAVGGIM